MFISKFILLIVSLSCISYSTQVKLTLYTEALCPYCIEFIITQLYPASQKLKDSFLVELVPLGNQRKGEYGWECDHGQIECYLNSVDACLISLKPSQSQLISFSYCHAKKASMHKSKEQTEAIVKQCAEENNLSWDDINTCLTDGTVDALLFANEEREQFIKPKVFGVPDIRFYDIFNMDLMMAARENLVATICNLINGTKPSACDEEFLNVKNLKKPKTC